MSLCVMALPLSPAHGREHLASLVTEEVGGGCPQEPGREPGVAKREVVGMAGWEVRALFKAGRLCQLPVFLPCP